MLNYKNLIYLIDMDGTIYRGSLPIPHVKEFIRYLQDNNRKFLMVTNCPGSSKKKRVDKLSAMGIEVTEDKIISFGDATVDYLINNTKFSRFYLIGSKALEELFIQRGLEIVHENPDCVVVGYDVNFTYDKLKKAVNFILNGAGFISTNIDNTIPEGSQLIPHTGAITASIEAATGAKPVIIGKPERYLLDTAIDRLHCSKEQCCVIGDRLDTDIYFGVKQNILSFLVLTGVTKKEMLEDSIIQPTKVFDDLSQLMLWDKEINRIV